MMKSIAVLVLLAVVARAENDQMKAAKDGLLSLMNMGVTAMRTAQKSINEHAFQTGEKVGQRLAADQKSATHSVETKMTAANEGLKDGVQDGVSLLQRGLDQAE